MERLSLEDNETGEESKDITNGTKQDNEERLTVDALCLLLGSCLKPGVHQNGAIERILEILQTGQLDPLLISPPPSQHIDWISDLVRCWKNIILTSSIVKICYVGCQTALWDSSQDQNKANCPTSFSIDIIVKFSKEQSALPLPLTTLRSPNPPQQLTFPSCSPA